MLTCSHSMLKYQKLYIKKKHIWPNLPCFFTYWTDSTSSIFLLCCGEDDGASTVCTLCMAVDLFMIAAQLQQERRVAHSFTQKRSNWIESNVTRRSNQSCPMGASQSSSNIVFLFISMSLMRMSGMPKVSLMTTSK